MHWLISAYSLGQTDVDPNLLSECLECVGAWPHSHLVEGLAEEWECMPMRALACFGGGGVGERGTFMFKPV